MVTYDSRGADRSRRTVFPGGHDGFSGGEYGMPASEPDGFAATLQEVLKGGRLN